MAYSYGSTRTPFTGKVGARHSAADQQALQKAHDATVRAGAVCGGPVDPAVASKLANPDATKASKQLEDAMAKIKSMRGDHEALTAQVAEMGRRAIPSSARRVGARPRSELAAKQAELAQVQRAATGSSGAVAEGYRAMEYRLLNEIAKLEGA